MSCDALIQALISKVLPPGWLAAFVPEGILADGGVAIQGMHRNEKLGGYMHPIKLIYDGRPSNPQATVPGFLERFLHAWFWGRNPTLPNPMTVAQVDSIFDDFYQKEYSEVYLDSQETLADKKDFANLSGLGSSVSFQSLVLAPRVQGTTDTGLILDHYPYPEFDKIKDEARKHRVRRVYCNIGIQNNVIFWDNELALKLAYPQYRRNDRPEPFAGLFTGLAHASTRYAGVVWSDGPHGTMINDVAAAIRLVGYVRRLLAMSSPPLERAIAGLVQLSNMILLRCTRIGSTIVVDAKRMKHDSPSTLLDVNGATAQLIHVMNGHEEQSGTYTTTNGQVTITLAATTHYHFDFEATPQAFMVRAGDPSDPVEVHVWDPALQTQSFILVP